MQSAKSAAAMARETAGNVAASAKAGLDKTKATVQEKVEKMGAHDPIQKDMATHRKEEKINQAEHDKQAARDHNAAAKHVAVDVTHHHSATGAHTGNHHVTNTGGFTTPDYLTGADISEAVSIPPHDINVEYPSAGLSPSHGPVDAVYPADIGSGRNQTHDAFGTGGLIN